MTEPVEWEWRQEHDLSAYEYQAAVEAWILYVLDRPSHLAVRHTPDEAEEQGALWSVYAILTADEDGIDAYEPLDGADTLEQAQAILERDRDDIVRIAREQAEYDDFFEDEDDEDDS